MNNPQTEAAKAMLTDVIRALCYQPDKLTVDYYEDDVNFRVCIMAHPSDVGVIVGRDGAHLKALDSLARLLFWGKHKLINIMPVTATEDGPTPYKPFVPKKDWNEARLIELMKRLAETVFPGAQVTIKSIAESSWANIFSVTVSPEQSTKPFRSFAQLASVLFVPIGMRHGRMIFSNVKNK